MIDSVLSRLKGDFINYSVLDNHFLESTITGSVQTNCITHKETRNILDTYYSARDLVFQENHQVLANLIETGIGAKIEDLLSYDGTLYVNADHIDGLISYFGERFVETDEFDKYLTGYVGYYRHNNVHIRVFSDYMFKDDHRYIPLGFTIKLSEINGKFNRQFHVDAKHIAPKISFKSFIESEQVRYLYGDDFRKDC